MIEITHSTARYTYRLSVASPAIIERRLNRHNARWAAWRMFESETEAKLHLIRMSRAGTDADEPQAGQP